MNLCLNCSEPLVLDITWSNVFQLSNPSPLCEKCTTLLPLITEPICEKCGRQMKEATICSDCAKWSENILRTNRAVFSYSNEMKIFIQQWKFRGDYIWIEAFEPYIKTTFTKYYHNIQAVLVPIPLTEERLYERAFNQAEAIATVIGLPIETALQRDSQFQEKQSKKTRAERLQSKNPFIVTKQLNKPVILVDDIYTTGMTIHHAANALHTYGVKEIYSFTLVR